MRRWVLAMAVAALLAAAAVMPVPAVSESYDAPVVPPSLPVTRPGLWYCPGAATEGDPVLAAASLADGTVRFSLPAESEFEDTAELPVSAQTGAALSLFDISRLYPGPAVLELSAGPSAGAEVFSGTILAGESCVDAAAKEWQLTGGVIAPGTGLVLRLFNPLLEPAKVSVQIVSEFGVEPITELDRLDVAARGWTDIDLATLLGERQQVSLVVTGEEGAVIPWLTMAVPGATAVWGGGSVARTWDFPFAGVAGATTAVSVRNAGITDVNLTIDVVTAAGTTPGAVTGLVPPGAGARLVVEGFADQDFGLIVRGDGPITAAVLSQSPVGLAATSGLDRRSSRWLVPALGSVSGWQAAVRILNPGEEPVTATARALDGSALASAELAPGSLAILSLDGIAAPGVLVEATGEVTVAWTLTGPSDLAAGGATAADD